MSKYRTGFLIASLLVASGFGCSRNPVPPSRSISKGTVVPVTANEGPSATDETTEKPTPRRRAIAPVEIGNGPSSAAVATKSTSEQLDSVREALKPFQILLGRWNSLSQKALADHPEWAYDWVSNPKFPSLKMTSEKGTYIREGRLAFLPDADQFEFTGTDAEGTRRRFVGTFIEPMRDVAGDEKKLQRTYKLQLTEPEATAAGEQWRMTFNQQENNRYILEIDRKRGNGPFSRVDTVHTQREGTSFALSESDYGDKTCIISQGLGTISVSYKGQSFWVCCTGCKAAFEEEPEKWIAKWAERKKPAGK